MSDDWLPKQSWFERMRAKVNAVNHTRTSFEVAKMRVAGWFMFLGPLYPVVFHRDELTPRGFVGLGLVSLFGMVIAVWATWGRGSRTGPRR